MGDPALNCWILQWTMGQMLAALHGHPAALLDYWNGNIFYPAKLTLAYSEHLTAQALQVLPLFAATGNILLCYNLLVLSTVALSGLAVFLLVRELTGHPMAAFVAGAAFALTPYRVSQLSHLQMLSSYWMPLALYGFRRFFVTGRLRPLVWGAAAVVLQNLSCGYLMLFFAPFAGAYCVYEVAVRGLWRSRRTWLALGGAAVGIALLTYPFVAPYLELRRISALGVRSMSEVLRVLGGRSGLRHGGQQPALGPGGAGLSPRRGPWLSGLHDHGARARGPGRRRRGGSPRGAPGDAAHAAAPVRGRRAWCRAGGVGDRCASVFLTGGFRLPFAKTLVVLNNGLAPRLAGGRSSGVARGGARGPARGGGAGAARGGVLRGRRARRGVPVAAVPYMHAARAAHRRRPVPALLLVRAGL